MTQILAQNVLQIGTTGMLRGAGQWLAERSRQTTILSRQPELFCEDLITSGHKAAPCSCDYKDPDDLLKVISKLNESVPPFDYLLAWIHGDAAQVLTSLRPLLSPQKSQVIRVVGSSFCDPDHKLPFSNLPDQVKRQIVVLGFVAEVNGSRWLSHEEINKGVIQAMSSPNQEKTIIGQISPWSERP